MSSTRSFTSFMSVEAKHISLMEELGADAGEWTHQDLAPY